MFKDVETRFSMYWIGNWIGSYPSIISFLDIDMMTKVKYWDLELDWVHRRSCICSTMSKPGFPCIGLEIGSGHILCVISFLGIDMMANLSIGIWNWIGVYLRSCLSSKMPKQGFPCIGLEISYVLFHF